MFDRAERGFRPIMVADQRAGLAAALQETGGSIWLKRIGQGTSPAACR
jgi:hypothetical protein